jgi:FtsP/CotA-like multicopper oxidase with cupredoxin domain
LSVQVPRPLAAPDCSEPAVPRSGSDFTEPELLSSSAGQLEVRLDTAAGQVTVGGQKASVAAYNSSLPGPTLRLRPGERLRATLANNLDEAANLHVHGLHVSPAGSGDNAFISVAPGASFDYEFVLPPGHPPGTFWYHPTITGQQPDSGQRAFTGPSSSRTRRSFR